MITRITVAFCDVCGKTEKAATQTFRNETEYVMPSGWKKCFADNTHVCPECAEKLGERLKTR